jgi:hypothetical protein
MVNVLEAGAPAMMVVNCHPIEQGWMLPLAGPHRRPGEVLLCVGICVGPLPTVTLIPTS